MTGEYHMYLRWPDTIPTFPSSRFITNSQFSYGPGYGRHVAELILKHYDEICEDLEDLDENKIYAALPRLHLEDKLPFDYEPLQKEVAMATGHYPFVGARMILNRYERVQSYKKDNGRIGFKDLVLQVWGWNAAYEVELEVKIADTSGMKWIVNWRKDK